MASFVSRSKDWRWPRFRTVGWLDLMLVLSIVFILNGLALRGYTDYTMQAKFSEILVVAGDARYEVIERFAFSGEPYDMPGGRSEVAVQRPATEHMKRPDVGTYDLVKSRLSQQAPSETHAAERSKVSNYVSSVRIEGSAVVVRGRFSGLGDGDREFVLAPLVQDGRVPQVIAWQCGGKSMPDGWTGPTVIVDRPVAEKWLPRRCRQFPGAPS